MQVQPSFYKRVIKNIDRQCKVVQFMCNALYFNISGRLDTISSSSCLRSTSKISRNLDPMNVKKSPGDYRVSDFLPETVNLQITVHTQFHFFRRHDKTARQFRYCRQLSNFLVTPTATDKRLFCMKRFNRQGSFCSTLFLS